MLIAARAMAWTALDLLTGAASLGPIQAAFLTSGEREDLGRSRT
jgi:hypothetical protein